MRRVHRSVDLEKVEVDAPPVLAAPASHVSFVIPFTYTMNLDFDFLKLIINLNRHNCLLSSYELLTGY
jgi:hypothetical protein